MTEADNPADAGGAAPQAGSDHEVHSAVRTMFGRDSLYMLLWALQLGAAALFTPLNTRMLGASRFGRVAAATAIMQVVFSFASLCIQQAIQRQYEQGGEKSAHRLIGVGVMLAVTGTTLTYLTGPLWSHWLGFGAYAGAARWAVIWGGLVAITDVSLGLIKSKDRLLAFGLVTLFQTVGGQVAAVLLVFSVNKSAAYFVFGMVLGQAAAVLIALWFAPPAMPLRTDTAMARRALAYSLPLVPGSLAAFALSVSDRLVLQSKLGTTAVGRYQVAYNIGALAMPLLGVLNLIWMPRLFALRDRGVQTRVMTAARDSLTGILVPIVTGLSVGAPLLLHIWVPPSYRPDSLLAVTTIVAASAIPFATSQAHSWVLLAAGKTWALGWTVVVSGLVNIGLNLILVPHWGIVGSAWATLASYELLTLLMRHEARKVMRLLPSPRLVYVQLAGAVAVITAFVYVSTDTFWLIIRALIAAGCLLWMAAVGNNARKPALGEQAAAPLPDVDAFMAANPVEPAANR